MRCIRMSGTTTRRVLHANRVVWLHEGYAYDGIQLNRTRYVHMAFKYQHGWVGLYVGKLLCVCGIWSNLIVAPTIRSVCDPRAHGVVVLSFTHYTYARVICRHKFSSRF